MAQGSILHRVDLEISDVDRSVYERVPLRVARHPSEGEARLVTRILAYALLYDAQLQFAKGISDGDEPALWSHDDTGQLLHWIDVGTPGAERIHAASKRAAHVSIVCHRGLDALSREMRRRRVHRAQDITVLVLAPDFVEQIAGAVSRNGEWMVVRTDSDLGVTVDGQHFAGNIEQVPLPQ